MSEIQTPFINMFIVRGTFYAFKPSFCAWHMHFVSISGPTITILLKIVREKDDVSKMSELFQQDRKQRKYEY